MATLTKSTGTVTLSGAVEKVTFPAVYGWVWIKNMSDADMFVGLSESVSAGADGVLSIPAGECGRVQTDGQDSVYLIGSGNALVVAQNYADCPFKMGAKGGEIPDLSAYAKTADVPKIKVDSAVSADTVGGHTVGTDVPENAVFTDTFINENLLINPDFKINQRGKSGTIIPEKNDDGEYIHTYFVDRWGIDSGSVTVNADGTLTLNGTISQIFENAVGDNVTASVSAGVATYDNSTKTFSITANGEIISWAKLEYGNIATPFVPPDPTTELLRCMRYYEVILAGADRAFPAFFAPNLHVEADISFKVPKRVAPSLIINGIRTVVATSTGYITSFVAFQLYQSDIYGMTINTVDQVVTELPSYLLGVTLDGSFAVDTEIY